jgi:F5/8 type C domain-containing protein
LSTSFYNKRYRTPDIEVQRLNDILKKQALERAQQERPTSELVGIPVVMESYCGFYDRFKAKVWPVADFGNFKFPIEPDGKLLLAGSDFDAGVELDDAAMRFGKTFVRGTPKKVTGLDDGGILHAPLDLEFNGTNQYIRILNNPNIRIREKMLSPPAGMDGFTWIFRLSPLNLHPEQNSYLYWKWDDNSTLYGVTIYIRTDGQIHFHVRRNGTVRGVYANNPFTLIAPAAGNYTPSNYMAENYFVVNPTGVVPADYIFFFKYRFSDNRMQIWRNNTDITVGNSSDPMISPIPFPEPPPPPPTTPTKITVVNSHVSNEVTPGTIIETGEDFFGIKSLYPFKSGASYWDSREWNNGQNRTITPSEINDCMFDPFDDFLAVADVGDAQIKILGNGIARAGSEPGTSGSPRMKAFGTWQNTEFTVYARRPNAMQNQESDLRTKTDHYCPEGDDLFGGYIFNVNWDEGKLYFKKEQSHNIGYTPRIASVNVELNGNTWYGFKGVTYNLPNGTVKNEFWMDTTGGIGGGTGSSQATDYIETYGGPNMNQDTPQFHLIFWGSYWQSGAGLTLRNNVVGKVQSLCNTDYYKGLWQYGGTKAPVFGSSVVHTETPFSIIPVDNEVTSQNVADVIIAAIGNNEVPNPDNDNLHTVGNVSNINLKRIYCVFVPPPYGIAVNANGAHYGIFRTFTATNAGFTASSFEVQNTVDEMTRTFTHETVSNLTTPKAGRPTVFPTGEHGYRYRQTGIPGGVLPGDTLVIQQATTVKVNPGNINVARYWSDLDGKEIAPGSTDTWTREGAVGTGGGVWVKKTEWIDNGTALIGGVAYPQFTGTCQGSSIRTNTNVIDQYIEYKWWSIQEIVPGSSPVDDSTDPEAPFLKGNMFDNNLSTYWKHSNKAAYAIADIGAPQRVSAVDVAWAFGNNRRYWYHVLVSNELALETFSRITPTLQITKPNTARQRFDFPSEQFCRYIMLAIQGHQTTVVTPPPPSPSSVVSVWLDLPAIGAQATATDFQEGNKPQNVIDNNTNTRWAANTDSDKAVFEAHWVEIDLLRTRIVTRMGIAWYKAHQRRYRYRVHVSTDHKTWNKVWPTDNSDYGDSDLQAADKDFDHVGFDRNWNARFVRITVLRNTTNQWASIWEVRIRGMEPKSQPPGTPQVETRHEAAVAEFDILGFPGTQSTAPFVKIYDISPSGPQTDEYFVKLHAPAAGSDFELLYNVTGHTWTLGEMGSGHDRTSRGEIIDEPDNAPIFNQVLTKISCYAQRFGSPTGKLKAQLRHRSGESSTLISSFGEVDVSTIPTSLTEIIFTKTANNHRMGIDDMVVFSYDGGDQNNYISLARTRPETVPDMHMVLYSNAANWEQISDAELDGRYYTGSRVEGTSNIIAAQRIMATNSPLHGQIVTKFTFYLQRKGTAPGSVFFRLLDPSDNTVFNFGSILASSITTTAGQLTAVTIDVSQTQSKASLVDYKIAVEYTGGDVSNHIKVRLGDSGTASDVLAIKSSNDVWRNETTKGLAGQIFKGGKTTIEGGSPIPPEPQPFDDYTHDAFLFAIGEENKKTKLFTIPPMWLYNGRANRWRLYGKDLSSTEITNFATNKRSISPIAFGKIFTPLTLREPLDTYVPPTPGTSFSTTSFSNTSFTTG